MPSSSPRLEPSNNPTNNDGGRVVSKWTLEEDPRLVKSWIKVGISPITGVDQKKSGLLSKVTFMFNQHARIYKENDKGLQRQLELGISIGLQMVR